MNSEFVCTFATNRTKIRRSTPSFFGLTHLQVLDMSANPEYAAPSDAYTAPTDAIAPDYATGAVNPDYGVPDDGNSEPEMAQYETVDPATDFDQDYAYEVGSRVVVAGYDCQGTLVGCVRKESHRWFESGRSRCLGPAVDGDHARSRGLTPPTHTHAHTHTRTHTRTHIPCARPSRWLSLLRADWRRLSDDRSTSTGTVQFVGPHHEKGTKRVGVVLDEPIGKHSGKVNGHVYFSCAAKCGLLVAPKKVSAVSAETAEVRSCSFLPLPSSPVLFLPSTHRDPSRQPHEDASTHPRRPPPARTG